MAAQTSTPARLEMRAAQAAAEEAARVALAGARPSLDEILSVWPAERRHRIVLRVKVGPAGQIVIEAHLRERGVGGAGRELERDVRRIRGDVPVVLELHEGRTVVLPLQALREPR